MPFSQNKGKQPQRETIEVEDDDARLQRIQRTLEKLNTVPPSAGHERLFDSTGPSTASLGSGEPLGDLLARVQAFLPELKASNDILAEKAAKDPRSVDVENVEGDTEVIHMNLGLGVFEDRTGKEGSDSSSDEGSSDADTENEDNSTTTGSEDTDASDSSSGDESAGPESEERLLAPLPRRAILSRPIKVLPRRARPEIVVLSETTTQDN